MTPAENVRLPKASRTATWGLIATLAALSAVAGDPAGAAPAQKIVDGVPHIMNGAKPEQGVQSLKLQERWRAGAGESDEVFGLILRVELDEQGNVYLLDGQLSHAVVFAPDGRQLRVLGREGEGPGEVRRPSDMLLMPDGSVGLVQTFPGKIIKVSRTGEPAGVFEIGGADPAKGGFNVLVEANCAGGNLVLAGQRITQTQTGNARVLFLASFDSEGREKVRYVEKTVELDLTKPAISEKAFSFVYPGRWDVAPDGRVWVAPERNRYAIHVHAPDGKLEQVIEREFTSRPRTAEEKDRVMRVLEAQVRGAPVKFDLSCEETAEDIEQVLCVPDGSVWVMSSRGSRNQPPGVFATYDVFDAQGTFVRQAAVQCPGDAEMDGLLPTGDGHFVMITNFVGAAMALQGAAGKDEGEEGAPMEIIYYGVSQ